MEAAMAEITFDRDSIDADRQASLPTSGRIIHRLRVLVRRYQMDRGARAKAQFVFLENADRRILTDIGIDPQKYRRYDWLKEMVRAMDSGPL
jgi:hypothetical protein